MEGGARRLVDNHIGDAGAAAIGEALKTNVALTELQCVEGALGLGNTAWRWLMRGANDGDARMQLVLEPYRKRGRGGDRRRAQDQRRVEDALVRGMRSKVAAARSLTLKWMAVHTAWTTTRSGTRARQRSPRR